MKIQNGAIDILIGTESTTIKLYDRDAGLAFAHVTLTPEQLSAALSRQSRTDCEIEVHGLNNVGKKMENKTHEFELPVDFTSNRIDSRGALYEQAVKTCPDGWIPENYFGSKDSFFTRDGKNYARVTIRRWILKP